MPLTFGMDKFRIHKFKYLKKDCIMQSFLRYLRVPFEII